jgi:hypothetical protein
MIRRLLLVALVVLPLLADDAPQWLRQLASEPPPEYVRNSPAVVLLDEQSVTLDESGKIVRTTRYAVRILKPEGRSFAVARLPYQTASGKVKGLTAWIIHPSGLAKKLGKDETADVAAINDDIYNETRFRVVSGSAAADPGDVFGYEGQIEERSVFSQFEWSFQGRLPVRTSRFELALPPFWRAESFTFNYANIVPSVSGAKWSWELHDLGPIESEESAPPVSALAPRLGVSAFPPDGARSAIRSFAGWADVSRWLGELQDPQMASGDALEAKAKELTARAGGEIERIQAIGRFAQSLRYVSIQMGIAKGGGYTPHPAVDVFSNRYGDCKDKANLMRTMLRVVGIEAYPVAIDARDPTYVRPEWPSPRQFDHEIVAVRVSNAVQGPAILEQPSFGRLLFFDPTDEETPVGWLPWSEQGSYALVVAGAKGMLVRLAPPEPTANHVELRAQVILSVSGNVTVKVRERSVGEAAITQRRIVHSLSRPDYLKVIEQWLARTINAASISNVESVDTGPAEHRMDLEFTAARYAKVMQNSLLVFRPWLFARRGIPSLAETVRRTPVMLNAGSWVDTIEIQLPDGFAVDELPDPARQKAAFGEWESSCQLVDGKLVFTRRLELQQSTIPPQQRDEVHEFFARVATADAKAAVLVRK